MRAERLVFELGIQASLVTAVLTATNEGGEDEYGDGTDGGADEVSDGVVAFGGRVGIIGNAGEHGDERDEVDGHCGPISARRWGGDALTHPRGADRVAQDGRYEREEAQHAHSAGEDPGEDCGDDELEEWDESDGNCAGFVERVAFEFMAESSGGCATLE